MKEKSRALILLSWLHDILLFEAVYILAAAIWNIRGQETITFLLNGLLMIFPVALSYIVICKCRNLWIFLVFSLIIAWGIHSLSGNIITSWLTVFVILFRFYVKMKQGEIRRKMREMPNAAGAQESKETWEVPTLLDAPRVPYCLILAGMYLWLLPYNRPTLLYLMLGCLAADFCVSLAYCYLENLDGFVKKNIRVANLPAGTMKKIGNAILLAGVAGLILFMLPAAIYHEEPLAKIRLKSFDMERQVVEFNEENTEPDYLMEELLRIKLNDKKTPVWLMMLSDLLYTVTLIGVIFVVMKLIFMAIRRAMESFSDDGDDEISFLGKDEDGMTEKNWLLRTGAKEGIRSPNRRIRRLYKKRIRRALKEKPYGNETPLELEHKAGLYPHTQEKSPGGAPDGTEKIHPAEPGIEDRNKHLLHELYEKARYGNVECSPEEANEYGKIVRRTI